ncbi:NAD(P)/FAD-dependent oxidoreductase [Streptomyces mobaraensis NBRC 13819 = DSM 40847]|uniref:Pyridine nucleotide-disulfide oxidoreductase n=1 Tax=Streptomyces mobaraensis (strain ATCC 29032 / DSM 40847 / JCM 4168 / NBRC 13819 / NCIMB 11159 / IPCR 16-22) TaxID=1223523 RepID=M3BPR7_STRM1|nr:NAD(P)/FAD-dependent oxidoreductase [Streptomyces mobaraensis]EMF01675.1 pyridine nucleotide-disulfide oxidoreductase [Streptomyces mobaraensis NBRC 13819 = DSM 40847]QTT77080.1 NAD(P)/FAD-dependent oxidoreductase [Streptomyces mobaraensis NBRC 13819 = DSM 40847]
MAEEVDVVVIGMGPGGEHVAGRLAEAGLRVVGVEVELVGGECPYWGCVPSKMMIRAGGLLAEARRIPGMAGAARVEPDWSPVASRIRDEATDDWNDQVAADRFRDKGGRLARGRGRLTGPRTVTVDGPGGGVFEAARGVVLATGTKPQIPPVPGLDAVPYWTNRDAIAATEPPGSLLVLGGGSIGVELAQVYGRFGTRVTVVEAMGSLVPADEPEAAALLTEVLAAEGITIRTDARAAAARHDGDAFVLVLESGEELTADRLLVATGRRADLRDLGLETVGLDPTARWVRTDGRMRAADGLWAAGDVTGHGAFTHVAMYEAEIVAREILGEPGPGADYRALPRVTFTDPEIGAVGLTEGQARDRGLRVRTGLAKVPSSARGWIHKAGNQGVIKLVEDVDRGILVGATTAGPAGGEMLYGLAVAVQAEVPVETLRHMIYAYPTFHRGVEDALRDLVKGG